jgi:hypothetical protein
MKKLKSSHFLRLIMTRQGGDELWRLGQGLNIVSVAMATS